jgi:serine/threonine protein kinase
MIDFDFPLSDNTNCLTPIGTHQYKSPEMRKGKEYDYKTDIWYLF